MDNPENPNTISVTNALGVVVTISSEQESIEKLISRCLGIHEFLKKNNGDKSKTEYTG